MCVCVPPVQWAVGSHTAAKISVDVNAEGLNSITSWWKYAKQMWELYKWESCWYRICLQEAHLETFVLNWSYSCKNSHFPSASFSVRSWTYSLCASYYALKYINYSICSLAWRGDRVYNVQRWKEAPQMLWKGQWWRENPKQGNNKSHSLSSSKCVSMPSAPGTEQMSRAFRNVLHLLTRQQCPPSSFCGYKMHSGQRSSCTGTIRSSSD